MHLQILDIWCKNVRQNCRDLKKKNLRDVLFLKSRLSKMASTKTNKFKKQRPLLGYNQLFLTSNFVPQTETLALL